MELRRDKGGRAKRELMENGYWGTAKLWLMVIGEWLMGIGRAGSLEFGVWRWELGANFNPPADSRPF